jgi:ELWxxDGT repeat protein
LWSFKLNSSILKIFYNLLIIMVRKKQSSLFNIILTGTLILGVFIQSFGLFPFLAMADTSPVLIKDINTAGSGISLFQNMSTRYQLTHNGIAYFEACNSTTEDCQIWVSDGTSQGTFMLKDIKPVNDGYTPSNFVGAGDYVYFLGNNPETNEGVLYKTDGTTNGTEIFQYDGSPISANLISDMFSMDDLLYFVFDVNNTGYSQLWMSDGTEVGTMEVASIPLEITAESMTEVSVRYVTNNGDYAAILLTTATTDYLYIMDLDNVLTQVQDSLDNPLNTDYIDEASFVGDKLFFIYDEGPSTGDELWVYDPLVGYAALVEDINSGGDDTDFNNFLAIPDNNKLFFEACSYSTYDDCEPWVSDGTEIGTFRLSDINAGNGSSNVEIVDASSALVYFTARNGDDEYSLFMTDGTVEGTSVIEGQVSGNFYNDGEGILYDGRLYLTYCDYNAEEDDSFCELWKVNNTLDGIELVKDIDGNSTTDSDPEYFMLAGEKMIFLADDNGIYGPELWVSDGTSNGTTLLVDINEANQGSAGDGDSRPLAVGGYVYFVADSIENGSELWRTDGTEDGTELVYDANGERWGSDPGIMGTLGDELIFFAYDQNYVKNYLLQTVQKRELDL